MAYAVRTEEHPHEWRGLLVERMVPRASVWRPDPDDARREAEAGVDRLLDASQVWRLVDGDRAAGHVWLGVERGDLVVYDVAGDPAGAAYLREQVFREARERELAGVQASCDPQDAARRAFADDPAFRRHTTNMVLDLLPAAAIPSNQVSLTPMTAEEFASFIDGDVESYAEERHAAGEPMEVALEVSRQQLAELLPQGQYSPEQHLFTVQGAPGRVGILWLGTERPVAFVYDVVVAPEFQGRGLGAATMHAAADWARRRGAPALGLNVFAPNTVARALYDRLGYRVVEDHYRAPCHTSARSADKKV